MVLGHVRFVYIELVCTISGMGTLKSTRNGF